MCCVPVTSSSRSVLAFATSCWEHLKLYIGVKILIIPYFIYFLPVPIYICASLLLNWSNARLDDYHCLKRMKQQLKFAKYYLLIIVQNRLLCVRFADDFPECQFWICSRENVAWISNHLHEFFKKRHAMYTEVVFGVKSKKMYLNLTYEICWWFSKWYLWNKTTQD
jgi:hypothetical protein